MPRKLHVIPHLSSTELKERYQTSHDPVKSRRWHLLWLVSEHHTLLLTSANGVAELWDEMHNFNTELGSCDGMPRVPIDSCE